MKIIGTNEEGLICVMTQKELAAIMGFSVYDREQMAVVKTNAEFDLAGRLGYVRDLDGLPETAKKMSEQLDTMRGQMDRVLRLTENTTFQKLNERKPKQK